VDSSNDGSSFGRRVCELDKQGLGIEADSQDQTSIWDHTREYASESTTPQDFGLSQPLVNDRATLTIIMPSYNGCAQLPRCYQIPMSGSTRYLRLPTNTYMITNFSLGNITVTFHTQKGKSSLITVRNLKYSEFHENGGHLEHARMTAYITG